jgi:hypothetical protein
VEGTITHYCATLKGTVVGGFQHFFSLAQVGCSPSNIRYTPPTSRTPKKLSKVDLKNEICKVQNELVEKAQASKVHWSIC